MLPVDGVPARGCSRFIGSTCFARFVAFIRVIGEDEAEGPLFEIYDEIQRSRGRLSNILRIESLNPKALKAHLQLYMATVFGKVGLSRRERELIAVVVSAANNCEYCYIHHGEALNTYVKDEAMVKQLQTDQSKVKLPARERALVDFAVGLTTNPASGREEAVKALRAAGLNDEEILHATEVVAYFNFVNRLASGLGVDLESQDARDYNY